MLLHLNDKCMYCTSTSINRLYWKFNVLWDSLKCYWLPYSLTAVQYWVIETKCTLPKTSTGNIALIHVILLHLAVCNDWYCTCDLLKHRQVKENSGYGIVNVSNLTEPTKSGNYCLLKCYIISEIFLSCVKCRCVSVKLHVLYKTYFYFIAVF